MKNKQDIDMASALTAMLEGDGRKLHVEVPTCPGDGSPWTIGYPGSIEKSVNILPVIASYKFEDIYRAIFCVNSWHQNRSAQGCTISLNAALISTETFGENPITTYEDFKTFYEELKKLNLVSSHEDCVIPVMGHTKLCFRGQWWPALYGCGLIHEYSRLCFADSICPEAGKEDEFESLLGYTGSMTTILDGGGWDGEGIGNIALSLPPESHWDNVNSWFEGSPHAQLPSDVVKVLSNKDEPIENIHFFEHDGVAYPLFNPSILTDYLGYCCKFLDTKTLTNAVDTYLSLNADLIYTSTILDRTGLFLWPRFKLAGEYIENCPVAFMLFDDGGHLTIFYDLYFGDGNLKELRRALVKHSPEIKVFESFKRKKGYRGLDFGGRGVKTVNLVAFVNDVAPLTMPSYVETSKVADTTCGALDLLSIIHASSSVEEINAYFTDLRKSKDEVFTLMSGILPHFWFWKDSDRNILAGAENVGNPVNIFSDYNDNDLYYCEFFGLTPKIQSNPNVRK